MSDTTARLNLPYLLMNQAQKEITHNEALTILDMLTNAVFYGFLDTPPTSPAEGDTYIIGPNPTGAWVGRSKQMVRYLDGSWFYVEPPIGTVAMNIQSNVNVNYQYIDGAWSYYASEMITEIDGGNATNTAYEYIIDGGGVENIDNPSQPLLRYDMDRAYGVPSLDANKRVAASALPTTVIVESMRNTAGGFAGVDGTTGKIPENLIPTSSINTISAENVSETANRVFVTPTQVAAWNAKQAALGYTPANAALIGSANGICPLNSSSQVSYSYVEEKYPKLVLEGTVTTKTTVGGVSDCLVVNPIIYHTGLYSDFLDLVCWVQNGANGEWFKMPYAFIQRQSDANQFMLYCYFGPTSYPTGYKYRLSLTYAV